jgi:RNA polymerase sigma factor for flagellar operon FliA
MIATIASIAESTELTSADLIDRYVPIFDDDRELAAVWVAATVLRSTEARDVLVTTYLPLVRYVVSRLNVTLPPSLERADLVGFGTVGLIDAVCRFDLERGFTFQTFAVTRIRGAVLDELRSSDWVPRSVRGRMHTIDRATVTFEQEHGCEPDVNDLAAATGLATIDVRSTLAAYKSGYVTSLDERMVSEGSSGEGAPGQQFVDDTEELPDEIFDHAESQRIMRQHIRELKARDRAVIALYYFEELTFAEIGRVLGVSESRACQVHGRAIRDLRRTTP